MTVDLVMASRYCEGGSSGGLDGPLRRIVSTGSTILARAAFPFALRGVTDPMTGFFGVRLDKMDTDKLRSRGFKILLEILARYPKFKRTELPLDFGQRHAGASKGDLRQGVLYLRQLPWLRLVTWLMLVLRWAALLGVIGAVTVALAVSPLSGAAVLALLVTVVASYNTIVGALEVRWRLYGWRTPEAVEQMRWPAAVPDEIKERFSIIVPALNEDLVIAGTLRHLLQQDHDDYEILVSLCDGDDATIAEVQRVQANYDPHGRVRTVVRAYSKSNKPRQLNAALEVATGTVIGVVDAEDDVAPQLLDPGQPRCSARTEADVVQGGVQLMTARHPGPRLVQGPQREWSTSSGSPAACSTRCGPRVRAARRQHRVHPRWQLLRPGRRLARQPSHRGLARLPACCCAPGTTLAWSPRTNRNSPPAKRSRRPSAAAGPVRCSGSGSGWNPRASSASSSKAAGRRLPTLRPAGPRRLHPGRPVPAGVLRAAAAAVDRHDLLAQGARLRGDAHVRALRTDHHHPRDADRRVARVRPCIPAEGACGGITRSCCSARRSTSGCSWAPRSGPCGSTSTATPPGTRPPMVATTVRSVLEGTAGMTAVLEIERSPVR